ncbi:hypothetical protein [Spirosoma aerolatum]|uniref:hypothetical protein n=1 Tax=Spirosoma aerolatum TaxID=1211326 RepID=UPI0012D2DA36|nr:hypothetical protein [Spirosoma aerolatum]
MRTLPAWLAVLITLGCHPKEPVLSINPAQLIGNWTSRSISGSEKPYTRWTFESDYVYFVDDTLKKCQSVSNLSYYRYRLEEDNLVMRYEGITNGLVPIPDIRRRIIAITANEFVLDSPYQVLEKCP